MSTAGIITQARMGSTRLPGKVLLTARGHSMLHYHVARLQASGLPIFIATTTQPADEAIAQWAAQHGIPCHRGDVDDVLSRYHETARKFGLDTIVRVTSDCPLLDGPLIGSTVAEYQAAHNPQLYISNGLQRTYPRGLDFEVFSRQLLEEAQRYATSLSDREHVTPYLHQNRSGRVEIRQVVRTPDASRYRLTLDTAPDFELLRVLFEQYQADTLSTDELIALLDRHPELVALNAEIEQQKYDFTR
ncbi:spore coat polysaccharide biosynthesis protein SpsF [Hymenobacter daecheongensis DSM 21074]|uniref:Spore coat polysaccharide biosynthesis protein SpsF n=1 Tax=Hymenobacter daecheongensis DSM 21074 TaxID=1121955 RepID=A0A1M6EIA9_9BACT|nr:glycosyltransferase family protein [Hymenobacter daecheongensis]SHI85050.1 spore coat polysaccharide biosynthesis protein SpsF [Hymenobacter daecheongensis DSM 21074]